MAGELKPINVLQDRGLMQMFLQDEVLKGLVIAPNLQYIETDTKRYDYFTREKTSKEVFDEGIMEDPLPSAPGSELLLMRGSAMQPDSTRLIAYGYRYIVDNDDMESSPESFLMDIEDMCYGIANSIEEAAVSTLIANATASTATIKDSVWSASSMIGEDLAGFVTEYLQRDIRGRLNKTFIEGGNFGELEQHVIRTLGINNVTRTDDTITYPSTLENQYAPAITHGSILGWDTLLPPASVVYRKLKGAYAPPEVKPGTERYLPVINCRIIPHDDLFPQTEYQFAAVYTIPVQRPKYIFYKTGI